MSRWTDIAAWVGPTVNEGDGDGVPGEAADRNSEVRGVVLHIAEGTYLGTIAWQQNPSADVSSHFVNAKDGRLAQVVDTADRAWTQVDGNGHWLTIEHEGYHGQELTSQQIENSAQILAHAQREYGNPSGRNFLQLANSPDGIGLGYHAMGGADWGGHFDCPGPPIIAQRPAIIARAQQLLGITEEDDMSQEQYDKLAAKVDAMAQQITNLGDAVVRVVHGVGAILSNDTKLSKGSSWGEAPNRLHDVLAELQAGLAALAARPPGAVDPVVIEQAVAEVVGRTGLTVRAE